MEYLSRKRSALFGIAASCCFLISWAISARFHGSWTYGGNTLSSLGYCDDIRARFFFNWSACIFSSILWIVMALGIIHHENGNGRTFGYVLLVSMFLLACVGIFDGRFGLFHRIVAIVYMLSMGVSMIFSMRCRFFTRRKIYLVISIGALVFDFFAYFIIPFEVFEPTAIFLAILWATMVSEAFATYVPETDADTVPTAI